MCGVLKLYQEVLHDLLKL